MSRALVVLTVVLGLGGCAGRKVPDHLRVDAPVDAVVATPPASDEEAIAQLVTGDPLVRRPAAQHAGWWATVDSAEALATWSTTVGGGPAGPAVLQKLEDDWPGSIAVPLARGALLAQLELSATGSTDRGDEGDLAALAWLGPVQVAGPDSPSAVGSPLAFLGPGVTRAQLVPIAERRVLTGWLADLSLPMKPVEAAMTPGVFDRLRETPTGALLVARANQATDPAQAERGRALLEAATALAIARVAADRAREHAEVAKQAKALAEAEGLDIDADPVPPLLATARAHLTADAHNDASLALALVAITAERLQGTCPDSPCSGLDLGTTFAQAGQLHEDAATWAILWQVTALADARERHEVSVEKGRDGAIPELADALLGAAGGGQISANVLRQPGPTPTAVLGLRRLVGAPDDTRPEALLELADAVLVDMVGELTSVPASVAPAVSRIAGRAG